MTAVLGSPMRHEVDLGTGLDLASSELRQRFAREPDVVVSLPHRVHGTLAAVTQDSADISATGQVAEVGGLEVRDC
ncbi:hypothetical protein [Nocardia amikacinitolerans]|uniref:hypothetical protein n=1 Tax=Nocardia amikacinitolerans TaxID=756689 RepID=UPI00147164E1|nr:hypothetical protein [Nocardia amikacinitolerans]